MRNYPPCRICGKPCGWYDRTAHLKCIKGKNHHNSKRIIQCNKEGNVLTKWNALVEVERMARMTSKSIRRALSGHRKTAYGFIWKYEA